MDTLLEQATPQTPTGRRILRQDYRGNEAYTVSRQDILAVEAEAASAAFFDGLRTGEAGTEKAVNAYEPLVKALRRTLEHLDFYAPLNEEVVDVLDEARAALATVESSPVRKGGE